MGRRKNHHPLTELKSHHNGRTTTDEMNGCRHLLLQSSSLVSRTAVTYLLRATKLFIHMLRWVDMMNKVTMIICTSRKSDYNNGGIGLGICHLVVRVSKKQDELDVLSDKMNH